jgi:hypothetical protein
MSNNTEVSDVNSITDMMSESGINMPKVSKKKMKKIMNNPYLMSLAQKSQDANNSGNKFASSDMTLRDKLKQSLLHKRQGRLCKSAMTYTEDKKKNALNSKINKLKTEINDANNDVNNDAGDINDAHDVNDANEINEIISKVIISDDEYYKLLNYKNKLLNYKNKLLNYENNVYNDDIINKINEVIYGYALRNPVVEETIENI